MFSSIATKTFTKAYKLNRSFLSEIKSLDAPVAISNYSSINRHRKMMSFTNMVPTFFNFAFANKNKFHNKCIYIYNRKTKKYFFFLDLNY